MVELEPFTVRRGEELHIRRHPWYATGDAPPDSLRVRISQPPRRTEPARLIRLHQFLAPRMEVQIFGVKKSADTRKAIRFFAERRIRAHFVDLIERPVAEGELQRFVQRFGIDALVDRESKRFDEMGLKHAQSSPSRWMERLLLEPTLLRLPLVRRLGQPQGLTIGLDEDSRGKSGQNSGINNTQCRHYSAT